MGLDGQIITHMSVSSTHKSPEHNLSLWVQPPGSEATGTLKLVSGQQGGLLLPTVSIIPSSSAVTHLGPLLGGPTKPFQVITLLEACCERARLQGTSENAQGLG